MSEDKLFSVDAERALLGSLLIEPATVTTIDIASEDFYIQKNRWIFDAMKSLITRGINPDYVTMVDELDNHGRLEEIGGAAYINQLLNDVSSFLNAPDYVEIVKDKARRRAIITTAQELAKAAHGADAPDDAIMRAIQRLTLSMRLTSGARHFSEFVSELYDDVAERYANPRDIYGLETGLKDFDKVTGGLQQGEALYIGGEPGVGKSILSIQMGMGMASHGYPGAIYSLEMRGIQVARRSVSSMGRIETAKLKTGRMSEADWTAFVQATDKAAALPVYMSDEGYLTTAALRADLARLVAQYDIKWFVLDYLYPMSDGAGTMEPTARTELLSSRIKLLCKEFNLAGITVNSVTKDGQDLRGSGQVKHDADIIAMLEQHTPDQTTNGKKHDNMRTLVFRKAREMANPRGYLHLVKDDKFPAFYDFEPDPMAVQRMMGGNGRRA